MGLYAAVRVASRLARMFKWNPETAIVMESSPNFFRFRLLCQEGYSDIEVKFDQENTGFGKIGEDSCFRFTVDEASVIIH